VAQERRFPCPDCGAEFHFKADEPRISAPCGQCGKLLTMPHGKFDPEHLTMGVNFGGDDSGKVELVLGRSMGWSTPAEREKVVKANAIYLIERWEEVRAFPYSSQDDIKKAGDAAMSAIWPKRTFTHNGKKYTRISNSKRHELVVTEVKPKKIEKPAEDSGEFKIY
jgi:hypothetical protein